MYSDGYESVHLQIFNYVAMTVEILHFEHTSNFSASVTLTLRMFDCYIKMQTCSPCQTFGHGHPLFLSECLGGPGVLFIGFCPSSPPAEVFNATQSSGPHSHGIMA